MIASDITFYIGHFGCSLRHIRPIFIYAICEDFEKTVSNVSNDNRNNCPILPKKQKIRDKKERLRQLLIEATGIHK